MVDHRTFQTVETPVLQKGEKASGKPDVVGALTLYQLLAPAIDNATALSAADAWDGDSSVVFTAKGKTCLRTTFAGTGTRRDDRHHRRAEPVGDPDAGGLGDRERHARPGDAHRM